MVLLLPKDPLDEKNIMLEIRAGTGGDEASLWAGDLLRMYQRYHSYCACPWAALKHSSWVFGTESGLAQSSSSRFWHPGTSEASHKLPL